MKKFYRKPEFYEIIINNGEALRMSEEMNDNNVDFVDLLP